MSVTIKDVADKAGVAPSTVSRVIHNNTRISQETCEKVRKVMDEIGYHPNAAARSLARGQSHTLGLIIPNSEDDLFTKPFFIQAMRGLSIEAQKKGYNIMFSFSSSEEEEVSFLKRYIRQNIVDGVILMLARENDQCMAYLEKKETPYAVIGRPSPAYNHALWVDNDNFQAMYKLVMYFLGQGKKNIAFLGGPASLSVTQDRLRGYLEALRTHGIQADDSLIIQVGDYQEKEGYEGAKQLLDRSQPDSIVAADDFLAFGAMSYMEDTGLSIPITGFNNTMKGQMSCPSLSSVDIQAEQLGMRAASLLIDHLEGVEDSPGFSIIATHMVERDSTR